MVEQLDIPYDPSNNSSFSLWVNHWNTFTGITDKDRSPHGERPLTSCSEYS
ncbi:hypothetical protein [Methanospirillum lacunae]|uniref:hypothetical protein n=1 Tax=Methanospirillum lacunae TaxID=668570 RepID=UPI001FE59473|nr:hypothetical protein [Methanospirillum lacunae]